MVLETVLIVAYLLVIGYLGYLGYRHTKSAKDYLLAGRKTHPFIMAMSYGATFISTSAIVGFGGVAGMFGMSILWLVFLNIFVGIFIAFVVLGGRTRRMGHHLDAHTFPELLGRRYQSRFIQIFAGVIIFLFIPLYAAAVLIGGCEYIAAHFNISYEVALLVFSVIIASYVVVGGLKGAMYSEALQGSIMLLSMILLLVVTYWKLGGVTDAHRQLTDLTPLAPDAFKAIGHQGWTTFPKFGWGGSQYNLWWIMVGTIILGVGIGVLAQPQLIVRFMTVKSQRELNRAVMLGGLFILLIPGTAYIVGGVSNAYAVTHGPLVFGKVAKTLDAGKHQVLLERMEKTDAGVWQPMTDKDGKPQTLPAVLADNAADTSLPEGIVAGRTLSHYETGGNSNLIIPNFIKQAMPAWFSLLFMLTLLAAGMSTLSSQFHALGTAIGRDVFEQVTGRHGSSITVTRVGIIIGIILAVLISYYARGAYFIARATAIFFGLCASAFLPAFVGGLFFKRMTKAAAIASMVAGFAATTFWLVFVKAQEASAIGLVQWCTGGKPSILNDVPNWPVVDPLLVALPIAAVVAVVVSVLTRKPDPKHIQKCFQHQTASK